MARIAYKYDSTANDSDKSWTVPTGEIWEILYAHVDFSTSATVGNRQMNLSLNDGTNDIADIQAGAVQAASQPNQHYWFAQGVFRETSFSNNEIHVPIADEMMMLPGWILTIKDSAAIDAAADDMIVSIVYKVYALGEV